MAAITPGRLKACLDYARIDESDDSVVRSLIEAAVDYLSGAGIPEPENWCGRYELAVKALTLHYYDHRDDTEAQTAIPLSLRSLINQLKFEAAVAAAAGEASE